jgi:hypothetical protein
VRIIKTGSVVKVSRLSPVGCSVSSVSYSVLVLCEARERWLRVKVVCNEVKG